MDLCLAVTGDESKNVLAAVWQNGWGVAERLLGSIRQSCLIKVHSITSGFRIDRLISLEELTAIELAQEIRTFGSVVVEHIARGSIKVQSVTLSPKAKI